MRMAIMNSSRLPCLHASSNLCRKAPAVIAARDTNLMTTVPDREVPTFCCRSLLRGMIHTRQRPAICAPAHPESDMASRSEAALMASQSRTDTTNCEAGQEQGRAWWDHGREGATQEGGRQGKSRAGWGHGVGQLRAWWEQGREAQGQGSVG